MNLTCFYPAVKLGLLRPGRTSRLLLLAPLLALGTSAHLAATPPQQVVPRYTLTNPGSTFNINPLLNGEGPLLNIQGAIVGIIQPPGATLSHAALFHRGHILDIGAVIAPTGFSLPFAINAAGEVVGYCYDEHTPANVISEAFVYQGSRALRFTVPESHQTEATSLNNLGQVVGDFTTPDDPDSRRAFLRQPNGKLTVLGTFGALQAVPMAINDRGQIAGWTNEIDRIRAFLLQPGSRTPQDLGSLGPDTFARATSINNLGQVVGHSGLTNSDPFPSHAFLYSEGRMRDLGTMGGITSTALGINNLGQIVGWSTLASSESVEHAFVIIGGQMRDLNKLLSPTVTGWVILIATDINDRGEIVALASHNSNPDNFATVILKPTL